MMTKRMALIRNTILMRKELFDPICGCELSTVTAVPLKGTVLSFAKGVLFTDVKMKTKNLLSPVSTVS